MIALALDLKGLGVGEHEVEFEAVFDYVVHPGRGVVVGVFDFEGGFEVGAGGGAVVLGG